MFCSKCGKKLGAGSAFCDGCGTPVENGEIVHNEGASAEMEDAINHRLNNVIRLRGTMAAIFAGIFVFFGILGLFFAEGGMGTILIYPALVLINVGVVLVPKFLAQYGSQRTFDPMLLTKGNMIVSFINIGAFLILLLAGDGHIIALLILIPDFLLLTQVMMIYSLAGQVSSPSTPKTEYPLKSEVKSDKIFDSRDSHSEDNGVKPAKSNNLPPVTANINATLHSNVYEVGQTVFARWDNGEGYFPGVVSAVNGNQLDISFLDGDKGTVPIADVLELHEAFSTLKLRGNWRNGGQWYSGKISKTQPLTMQYDDGDVEEIKLEQLCGTL